MVFAGPDSALGAVEIDDVAKCGKCLKRYFGLDDF